MDESNYEDELTDLKSAILLRYEQLNLNDYPYSISNTFVTTTGNYGAAESTSFYWYYFTPLCNICVNPGDVVYLRSNKFLFRIAVLELTYTASFSDPSLSVLEYINFTDKIRYYKIQKKGYLRISVRLATNNGNSVEDTKFTASEVLYDLVILRRAETWKTVYDSSKNSNFCKYISYNTNDNTFRIYTNSKYFKMSDFIDVDENSIYRIIQPLCHGTSQIVSKRTHSPHHVIFYDENKDIIGGFTFKMVPGFLEQYRSNNVNTATISTEVRPVKNTKYMTIQWYRAYNTANSGDAVYDYQFYDNIQILATKVAKEYPKALDFNAAASFHNSAEGIEQFLAVADSYYDQKITVNGEEKNCLEYTTALRSRIADSGLDSSRVLNITSAYNRYTGGIDCSAFVGMVLRGINFRNTYYYGHAAGDYLGDDTTEVTIVLPDADMSDEFETEAIPFDTFLQRNPLYDWSFSSTDYSIPSDVYLDKMFKSYSEEAFGYRKAVTAADLCYLFESWGNKVYLDDKLTNIDRGDLIFFARYSSAGYTAQDKMWVQPGRYKHINHVAVIYDKIKVELDSNGNPIYDSAGKRIVDSSTSQSIITGKYFENTGSYWDIEKYPYIYMLSSKSQILKGPVTREF